MEYLVGVGLAAAVYIFAMVSGFDRERVFYPTVLMVVGHYYILFAAMGGSTSVLALESLAASAFLALAVIGFKKSHWLTAAALAGHGIFDFFHHLLIQNPGVPAWWPGRLDSESTGDERNRRFRVPRERQQSASGSF